MITTEEVNARFIEIEWSVGEVMETVSYHDKEVELLGLDKDGNEYRSSGLVSCGELVEVYTDIEFEKL